MFPTLQHRQLQGQEPRTASKLEGVNLTGCSFAGQNLTNAIFGFATLTNADFTGAAVARAYLGFTSLTSSQLYSTASYKAKNLAGIELPVTTI